MLENQRLKERLEQFLNGNLSVRSKNDDKKDKKTAKRRGKNAIPAVETLIEEGTCNTMQRAASFVSAKSHTKAKLICSNARCADSGIISGAWASLEQKPMPRTWSSAA